MFKIYFVCLSYLVMVTVSASDVEYGVFQKSVVKLGRGEDHQTEQHFPWVVIAKKYQPSHTFESIVVRCKPDYLFSNEAGGWLKLHPIPATWQEAFLRCYHEGAVLASPLNKELAHALHTKVTQFGVDSDIFLGTHDLYSKGHFASVEGVPLSDMEIKWGLGGAGTGDCFTLSSTGNTYHMSTSSCEVPLPFICFRKFNNLTTNECGTFDDEYHFKRYTGSCYKVHRKAQTWTRAYGICASEGGHLVILNDILEARIIRDMFLVVVTNELSEGFFVGLGAWGMERTWTTINGERFEDVFNHWHTKKGQPDNRRGIQNRAVLDRDGYLYDIEPEFEAMFVCEKSPQSIQFEAPPPVTKD